MTLRTDHVAGAFFIAVGLLGDRPQRRSADRQPVVAGRRLHAQYPCGADHPVRHRPGAARRARARPLPRCRGTTPSTPPWWRRSPRPRPRVYDWLGFLTTDVLLIFALLVVIERRRLLPAAVYSLGLVVLHLCAVRLRAQDAARTRAARILGLRLGNHPAQSLSRLFGRACSRPMRGTRFSAAWSARWSACCPASARSPASPSCCR